MEVQNEQLIPTESGNRSRMLEEINENIDQEQCINVPTTPSQGLYIPTFSDNRRQLVEEDNDVNMEVCISAPTTPMRQLASYTVVNNEVIINPLNQQVVNGWNVDEQRKE